MINLSLGGFDRRPDRGAGDPGRRSAPARSSSPPPGTTGDEGNPLSYPASFAHVLTVGATDESDQVADFSSASSHVDLAAPGLDMPVAVPQHLGSGRRADPYDEYDGTSFSAPLVSGAAAAVWTLRPKLDEHAALPGDAPLGAPTSASAAGTGTPATGSSTLPAALTRKAPAADPQEPNEDVYLVKPNGLFKPGTAADGSRATDAGARAPTSSGTTIPRTSTAPTSPRRDA